MYSTNWSVVLGKHQDGTPSAKASLYLSQFEEEDHENVKIENMFSFDRTIREDGWLDPRNRLCPYVYLSLNPVRDGEI